MSAGTLKAGNPVIGAELRTRLLERESHIAALNGWLERVSAGERRIALVFGEAGIGKTALLTDAGTVRRALRLIHIAERCTRIRAVQSLIVSRDRFPVSLPAPHRESLRSALSLEQCAAPCEAQIRYLGGNNFFAYRRPKH